MPTANKRTIQEYIDGFNALDHEKILSCLTDDVVWEMPGLFRHVGKLAFDREIENPAFTGCPVITIQRMTEENDVIVLEGDVVAQPKGGEPVTLAFCDVFEMREAKIQKLIGFIAEKKKA